MTTESQNLARVRAAYRAWHETKGQSVSQWMELMSSGVRFRSLAGGAPGMEFSRDCASCSEVERYFAELGKDWDMIHYTVDELIERDDRIIMLGSCSYRSKRTGRVVETPKADFLRLREGKVVEFFEFYDTAKAIAASLGT